MEQEKIEYAKNFIKHIVTEYRNPVFMCSFGKDSMVLLDIIERAGVRLPVLFHRDPWWPNKYKFADRIIAGLGLEVHDYPPERMSLWEGKEIMAFTSHYRVGSHPEALMQVPKNILPPDGRKFLCGLKDVLKRPTGGWHSYPWDVALVGHKNSDQDQIAGKVTLNCDIKNGAGLTPDLAFPLRYFTDDDIWDYTEQFGVPQQEDRYNVQSRKELPDKMNNSDYAHVCIACCDSRSKALSVKCPKNGAEMSCAPSLVSYESPQHTYYGDQSKNQGLS
jgi:hypothetical protein